MSRRPVRHSDDARVQVSVRVPGWLKNRVADAAGREGVSINTWCAGLFVRGVEGSEGFPEPPPAQAPVPSPERVLRGFLTGEDVLEPCGRPYPCERSGVTVVEGLAFCVECRIRVE